MKMIKKLMVLGSMFVIIFSFSGCGNKDGFEIGFGWQREVSSPIMVAARSDKTEFDIDDVTIEFSFGWYQTNLLQYSPVGFALYFIDQSGYSVQREEYFDDYTNQEAMTFIRIIETNEFVTEDYKVEMTRREGKSFSYSEKITIPKSLLNSAPHGSVLFLVSAVLYSHENDSFFHSFGGTVELNYELINENTIKIRV
jgi:hypothetical protein